MTTAQPTNGTWVQIQGKYHVRIHGANIDHLKPILPRTVDVYRRDGTATRHAVTGLIYSGADPVVRVERRQNAAVPGIQTPAKPSLMWKHSKRHSKLIAQQDYDAIVHPTRQHGQTMWTFTINRHVEDVTVAVMAIPHKFRKAAVQACEATIEALRDQDAQP